MSGSIHIRIQGICLSCFLFLLYIYPMINCIEYWKTPGLGECKDKIVNDRTGNNQIARYHDDLT